MNKLLKIIVINLTIFIIIFSIIEFIIFMSAADNLNNFNLTYNEPKQKLKYNINMIPADKAMEDYFITHNFRDPVGLEYKKKPVFLFGCSYTYGSKLNDTQTLGYKLSHISKRPVYNRGIPGKGIQHMYWQLNSPRFYEEVKVVPEYIIYGYSFNLHAIRLYMYVFQLFDNDLYLRYYPDRLDKNGDLIEKKPILPKYLNGLYIVRYLEELYLKKINRIEYNTMMEDFVFLTLHKSKEKALQHYPDVKFVLYCFDVYKNEIEEHPNLLQRLKDDGFIIVKQTELSDLDSNDKEYKICDNDPHPNENYWNEITPKLAKKLNL